MENSTAETVHQNFSDSEVASSNNWTWNVKDPAYRILTVDPGKLELHLQNPESMIIVPILVVIMFCLTVLLVVIFKQYPSLVSASAAAFLTFLGVFITLNALNEKKVKYA